MTEMKDSAHLSKLKNISFQPVFILGLHRSGTSILYKMLSKTHQFNPVTAYHIICYHQLLHNHLKKQETHQKNTLTQQLQHHGIKDRGIDRLSITADFEEEYGFLLSNQSNHPHITSKNKALFIQLAQKIQYIANNKLLLLKNPFDFSNFLYLYHLFPNARFIFIHRHPYKTLSSLMKAFCFLLKKKNYYTIQLSTLYTKVFTYRPLLVLLRLLFLKIPVLGLMIFTLQTAQTTRYYQKNITKLPTKSYCAITYEQLCKHPNETIAEILTMLQKKNPESIDFSTYIKPRKTTLHPSIYPLQHFIYTTMKPYFDTFQYTPQISEVATKKEPA